MQPQRESIRPHDLSSFKMPLLKLVGEYVRFKPYEASIVVWVSKLQVLQITLPAQRLQHDANG